MALSAQDKEGKQKAKIKFRSRALLDGAVSALPGENAKAYFRVEDLRLGANITYDKISATADVGFSGGEIAVKDIIFNYSFKNFVISAGNAFEPFSLEMLMSSADMMFNYSASSAMAFGDSRKLGITGHFHNDNWYAATGVYTHNDINNFWNGGQKNSVISTSRLVWRTRFGQYGLVHAGGAFSFRSADLSGDKNVTRTLSSAGVSAMLPTMLSAGITNAAEEFKWAVEFLLHSSRFMVQAEYYFDRFNRTQGGQFFFSHGGYAQAGFLLIGKGYVYDDVFGIPCRPSSDRALELALRVDYTDLNDNAAAVSGGEETSSSGEGRASGQEPQKPAEASQASGVQEEQGASSARTRSEACETEAEEIVELLNEKDYETLQEKSTDQMKTVMNEEYMEGAKAQVGGDWGEFQRFTSSISVEAVQQGKHFAITELTALYENRSVTYQISFDENMELAGIYMR